MSHDGRFDRVSRRLIGTGLVLGLLALQTMATLDAQRQQPPPKTAAQEGFVPVDELPPEDRLPAAPLLIAAYAVAWAAILVYVWSLWRRLSRVEQEMAALDRRVNPQRPPGARP